MNGLPHPAFDAIALLSSGGHPTATYRPQRQHDDLMMTQVIICQLLRQQVTVRLSATRRTDTLMWCFVFTA